MEDDYLSITRSLDWHDIKYEITEKGMCIPEYDNLKINIKNDEIKMSGGESRRFLTNVIENISEMMPVMKKVSIKGKLEIESDNSFTVRSGKTTVTFFSGNYFLIYAQDEGKTLYIDKEKFNVGADVTLFFRYNEDEWDAEITDENYYLSSVNNEFILDKFLYHIDSKNTKELKIIN